jgi:hypothetical protein
MLPFLESSHWEVDIILLVDDVHTLVNVIIVNPTCGDLVS